MFEASEQLGVPIFDWFLSIYVSEYFTYFLVSNDHMLMIVTGENSLTWASLCFQWNKDCGRLVDGAMDFLIPLRLIDVWSNGFADSFVGAQRMDNGL